MAPLRFSLIGLALLFVSFLFTTDSAAQQFRPPIQWQKSLGGTQYEWITSMVHTPDGNFVAAGQTISNDGDVGTIIGWNFWVIKFTLQGQVIWKKTYGGAGHEKWPHIENTPDGGFILTGETEKNGVDTFITDNHGLKDALVIKLDQDGNIQWKKCYGGSGNESGVAIINAPSGGYLMLGQTNASIDGDVSGNHGSTDVWVVKLSVTGTVEWQRCYGGTGQDYSNGDAIQMRGKIKTTSDGGYIFTSVGQSSNGDIAPNGYHGAADAWVVKITATGSILWSKCFGGTRDEYATDVFETADHNFLVAASTSSDDGNVIPGNIIGNGWLLKVNGSTGSLMWQKSFGGNNFDWVNGALIVDDNIYMVGTAGSTDIPGNASGGGNGWFIKMDLNGNLIWQFAYGGTRPENFSSLLYLGNGEFIVGGSSQSSNGDVTQNKGQDDFWVVRLGATNVIKGYVYVDNNNNGVRDVNEQGYRNSIVKSEATGKTYSSFSRSNGQFINSVDVGSFATTVTPVKPYFTVNPSSRTSNFTSYNNTDSFDFALTAVPGKNDLVISLIALDQLRAGRQSRYLLTYSNEGTTSLSNVVIKLVKSSKQNFISAVPALQNITADTLTWNVGSMPFQSAGSIVVTLTNATPPALNFGDVVTLTSAIEPIAGDETPVDNRDTLVQTVRTAFDPNDKTDNTNGVFTPQQVASGKPLQYTIRFQNTGNDTAFKVVVRDTLESKLDLSSIQTITASHPYALKVINGNILEWTFDNILLPDSNVNEPASHGYIVYRIKPKATVAVGDIIANRASIYFDFNLPVKTNTFETIIKSVVSQPSVSGVAANYCSTQGAQIGKITNLPAGGSGVTTSVKLDGNPLLVAPDSSFSFNVSTLTAAAHIIEVMFSNGSETKTTTLNFIVTATVTPDVNVSANSTTVVNLIDPVVITAANAAGGGTTPLYTFGKDRNFASVWQTEGSSNVLNIAPTVLQSGDNWIYVRMKTSSTCFISQFNIDSIKITLQLPVPNQPVITGINANYCVNEGWQKAKITNYPAAGTGSTVTVKIDGNAVTIAADSSFSFNVTTLGGGAHVAEVTYTNPSGTKTTSVNFTVTALVTPDVNVTANVRNVSSLTDPIIVTASNATGGGQTPAYTFARNRTFTDIIQAEGTSASLTLNPTALKLGENWIYVRMKTSSTCYSQQIAIDSIGITRFGSRGLVDPDFPDQVITSNPNPFRSQINVYGLNADKSYTIMLYNQQGKVMRKSRVIGRTVATLLVPGLAAGSYMLSIYDETKKRLIGSISVLKQ